MNARLHILMPAEPIELDRLARMRPSELQRLYLKLFGRAVTSGSAELARRRIARHFQSERQGGLPDSARQHALAIAKASNLRIHLRRGRSRPGSEVLHATVRGIVSDHDSRLPMPGCIIVKEHCGKTLVVRVLDDGFEYAGHRFPSLSAIAKEITGTKWNGFLFFGLTKEGKRGR
jgi:hypothetical protein